VRFFTTDYYDQQFDDHELGQRVSVGSGMDGKWNSFTRVELNRDQVRVGDTVLQRFRPRFYIESSPGRVINFFSLDSYFGDEIDFANGREGRGVTLIGTLSVRPGDHLELRADASRRWLDVDAGNGLSGRLFTARAERLRATWAFNSRSFVRLVGQYVETRRDTSFYLSPRAPKDASLSGSGLFAYKINWQTVLYVGYGDERSFADVTDRLEPSSRQWFTKVSYAWQH
jgi:hypothetical protein